MQALLSNQVTDPTTNSLFNRIAELTGEDFDTVIHVGAGAGADLHDYQRLGFERLILVEGDAESAEELRASIQIAGVSGVKVIEQAVAENSEDATWYRFNLPALNGITAPGKLKAIYPRLRLVSREMVSTISLQQVIDVAHLDSAARNLLVLDVPDLENALIASLSEDSLYTFGCIVAYGHHGAESSGEAQAQAFRELLRDKCFQVDVLNQGTFADWPVVVLRRDDVRRENRELRGRIAHLMSSLDAGAAAMQAKDAELVRLAVERDDKAKVVEDRRTQIEQLQIACANAATLATEQQAQLKDLATERDALRAQRVDLQKRLEQQSSAYDALAKQLAQSQQQVAQLGKERDERAAERDALRIQLTELSAKLQAAEQAHAQQGQQAVDLQKRLEQLTLDRDELDKQLAQAQQQMAQASKERDEQTRLAGDRQAQLRKLTQERDAQAQQLTAAQADVARHKTSLQDAQAQVAFLNAKLTAMEMRHDLLAKEMLKAEGQIDLIKEVLLREADL